MKTKRRGFILGHAWIEDALFLHRAYFSFPAFSFLAWPFVPKTFLNALEGK